jgi:hypothetical protein
MYDIPMQYPKFSIYRNRGYLTTFSLSLNIPPPPPPFPSRQNLKREELLWWFVCNLVSHKVGVLPVQAVSSRYIGSELWFG